MKAALGISMLSLAIAGCGTSDDGVSGGESATTTADDAVTSEATQGDTSTEASTAAAQETPTEMAEVTVMLFPGYAPGLPHTVADQEGLFAERGLDVERVEQPTSVPGVQGFEAVDGHIGLMSLTTIAQGYQAGVDVKMFCGAQKRYQAVLLAAPDSDLPSVYDGDSAEDVVTALADVETFGVQTPVGSGLQLAFDSALQANGITDVTYVNTGPRPDVVASSLASGSLEVAQIGPPGWNALVHNGEAKPLMPVADLPGIFQDAYSAAFVAPTDWLEENEEVAAAYCDAIGESLEFLRDEGTRDQALDYVVNSLGVDEAIAGDVLDFAFAEDRFGTALPQDEINTAFDGYTELGVLEEEPKVSYDTLVNDPTDH